MRRAISWQVKEMATPQTPPDRHPRPIKVRQVVIWKMHLQTGNRMLNRSG